MEIKIKIKDKLITLILLQKKNVLDQASFQEDRNLSERLLPTLDKLIKKNKLSLQDFQKSSLDSDVPESYTTDRIARSVVQALNFALKK